MAYFLPVSTLVSSVTHHLLLRTLQLTASGACDESAVGQVLLALIFHCSRDPEPQRGFLDLAKGFDNVANADFVLDKVPAAACVTVRMFFFAVVLQLTFRAVTLAGRGSVLSGAYICTSERFLRARRTPCVPSAWRTDCREVHAQGRHLSHPGAGVCGSRKRRTPRRSGWPRRGDVVRPVPRRYRARRGGRRCGLTSAGESVADRGAAARAVERMVRATDFDVRMLHLAIKMATQKGMKDLLVVVLDVLLQALRRDVGTGPASTDRGAHSIVIVRCLVRMIREQMAIPGIERFVRALLRGVHKLRPCRHQYIDALLRYLKTGTQCPPLRALVSLIACSQLAHWSRRHSRKSEKLCLRRTLAGFGAQRSTPASSAPPRRASQRSMSRRFLACAHKYAAPPITSEEKRQRESQLLEFYVNAVIVDAEPDAYTHIISARFAAVCGRGKPSNSDPRLRTHLNPQQSSPCVKALRLKETMRWTCADHCEIRR
jgi:hypothetical protein